MPDLPLTNQQVADKLLSAYQELAETWQAAEDKLREYHIPEEVSVAYMMPDNKTKRELVFAKTTKGFRILDSYTEGTGVVVRKPITEAAFGVRIAAIDFYDILLYHVKQAAERWIPKLDNAIQQLKDKLKL